MNKPRRFRLLWLLLGHLLFAIGAIGIFVPLLPTTPIWLLAVVCYSRSSEKFEHYIMTHPKYGQAVTSFRKHGIVSRKAKILATSVIFLSASIPTFIIPVPHLALILMWSCLAGVLIFLWSRPERTPQLET